MENNRLIKLRLLDYKKFVIFTDNTVISKPYANWQHFGHCNRLYFHKITFLGFVQFFFSLLNPKLALRRPYLTYIFSLRKLLFIENEHKKERKQHRFSVLSATYPFKIVSHEPTLPNSSLNFHRRKFFNRDSDTHKNFHHLHSVILPFLTHNKY